MELRVTFQTLINRAIAHSRRQTDQIGALQEQAATGKRILTPSDDPLGALNVLAAKAQDERLTLYLTNIQSSRSLLDTAHSALREAGTLLAQAQQIAIEGSHSANNASTLEALAAEIDGLIGRVLDLANTEHAGRQVFAGTASGTVPFVVDSTDAEGRPLTIRYDGSLERGTVPVGLRLSVPTLYTGQEVFQQANRGNTLYAGPTGAAAGTAIDSAVGNGSLLVRHTATTYVAGSGVQPGVDSAAQDTVLGPLGTHQLVLTDTSGTGAFGTVSLNGGPVVAFTSADTNLKVTGPNGEVVFLDTTAITPGFSGTVDLTADGALSVDDGVTEVPLTFSANQQVIHGATGAVTNVNTTAVRRAGVESVEYQGTGDVFQTLIALRDDLRNVRGLTESQQIETLSRRIAEVDRVRSSILDVVGEQGVSLQNLEGLETRAQDVQLELRKLTTDLEGVDLTEVVLDLRAQENLLQLTLAASARLFDQSLLDFIR